MQRTVRTAHLSVLMIVHNCRIQYNTEQSYNLPCYLQTNTIAQMLSIRGEGQNKQKPVLQVPCVNQIVKMLQ